MCYWFLDHGRCGEDFPKYKKEYLFIPDELVTTDNLYSKSQKQRCLERSPSSKESRSDDNFSYYEYPEE